MVLMDWMEEEDLVQFLNKKSFEEIITMLKSEMTHGGEVEELKNNLISVYTAGWSDNEDLVHLLRSPFCVHHYNYIGQIWATSYFIRNKDIKFDYDYEIVATKKKEGVAKYD